MSNPEMTVGIPFHGESPYLELAVRSVFAQTLQNWELILISDGANDGALKRVHAIADSRVRVIPNSENRGVAVRLNEISYAASAEIVARMDSDDIMFPTRLEKQFRFMTADPSVDLVASRSVLIDERNRPLSYWGGREIDESPALFFSNNVIVHPTVTVRRDWALRNQYDQKMVHAQDKELWLRAHPHSRFVNLSEPLVFYRFFGDFDLHKYCDQRRSERDFVRKLGPGRVSQLKMKRMIGESFAKEAAYRLSHRFGLEGQLKRRLTQQRTSEIASSDLSSLLDRIDAVVNTAVPGWD